MECACTTFFQPQIWLLMDAVAAAATLAAFFAAVCCSINCSIFFLPLHCMKQNRGGKWRHSNWWWMHQHIDPDLEWVCQLWWCPCLSSCLRASVDFLEHKLRIKGAATALSPGYAAVLVVDHVLCDATTLVVAAARVDAAGASSFNGASPPFACVSAGASCLALQRRGEWVWLDDAFIVLMNFRRIHWYMLMFELMGQRDEVWWCGDGWMWWHGGLRDKRELYKKESQT